MAHKNTDRPNGTTNTQSIQNGSFAVEEAEFDPTRRGYTIVPNYFAYYWTPLLGAKAALTYERLCSFAHGNKDHGTPTIALLADILRVDRHDLTGRIRRDGRGGRQQEYYQKGFLQQLVEAGLLQIEIERGRRGDHYKFIVRKYPPLLTTEQLAQLTPRLQRMHQEALERCRRAQERWSYSSGPTHQKRSGSTRSLPSAVTCDGVTGEGVTASQVRGDGVTGDLNTTDLTAQKEHLSPPPSSETTHVRDFYQQIGQPKVSQQKVKTGVHILADLQSQGFSLVDIVWAMTWIVTHQDRFGGKVHSLALLPQVIGQALQEKEVEQQRTSKLQQQSSDEHHRQAEITRRQELERLYQSLPPTEQAHLREVAVTGLLHSGIEQRFLLEPLIRGEVCRLLAQLTDTTSGSTPVRS